jgi:hypothetical protein
MKRALPVIAILIVCIKGFGQDPDPPKVFRQPFVQLTYHTGVYWSRTIYLDNQISPGYKAFDARFGFQSTGGKPWQQYHNYPRYGFGIHYADLIKDRSDTILGNPLSVFGFYKAPWARFGPITFCTDMGLGLSYFSVIHDPETNPYNDLIASHINLFFDFNFNLGVTLSQRFDLCAGFGVSHYSNGRIHMPQKGVNHWGGSFSLSYFFNVPGNSRSKTRDDQGFRRAESVYTEPTLFEPYEELQVMYAAGVVEAQELGDTEGIHFFTSSFTVDYASRFSYRGAVTLGADVLYDGSIELAIKGIAPEDVTTFEETYLGGHIGYQFIVDRVTILINLGTYFMQHTYDRGFIFSRWGGRLQLTDHLHANICINTRNGVRADWIEWGMAYTVKVR